MANAGAFGEVGASYFVHPEREGLDFLMDKQWAACSENIRMLQQFFCRFTTRFQVNKTFIDFTWEHLAANFHSGCTTSSSSPGLVFDHWIWLSSNAC